MQVKDPALASELVFVPSIGFRPAGTRILLERAETTADGTRLIVLAVAAAPDRTDVHVEWAREGEPKGAPASCSPGSQVLSWTVHAPLEKGVRAALLVGAGRLDAITMVQRAFHIGMGIGAIHALTFPPLAESTGEAELEVIDGPRTWRVPLSLGRSVSARPLAAKIERDGIAVRATALAHHEDELIVQVEIEGALQVRQVGAPLPTGPTFSAFGEQLHGDRKAEMRRHFGDRARPITLEDDRGTRQEEVRRLLTFDARRSAPGLPFVNRFSVVFDAPSTGAKRATLVLPFVDVSDSDGSATADLRSVPLDLAVGEHHFRVVSAWPHSNDHRRVIVEGKPSPWPPRFRHPAGMRGAGPDGSSWPNAGLGEQVVFDAAVGDPPIVTFTGAVMRIDGPLRLEISLA